MKITELKIGDRVKDKTTQWELTVVGIWGDPETPDKGTVYLDFEENEADVWEVDVKDIDWA